MRACEVEFLIFLLSISLLLGCGLQKGAQPEPVQTEHTIPDLPDESDVQVTPEMVEEYARIHQISDLKTAEFYLTHPEYSKEHPYTPTEEDIAFYERAFLEKMYPKFSELAAEKGFMRARHIYMSNPPDGGGSRRIGIDPSRYTAVMRQLAAGAGEGASSGELNPLLEYDPAASHYQEAMKLHSEGKLDDAIGRMKQVVKLKPEAPGFLYNLGIMYMEKRDYTNASQSLQNCLQQIKSTAYTKVNLATYRGIYVDASTSLGLAYMQLRMFDEAVEVLKEAIQFRPDDLGANWNLATTYYNMGDVGKAAEKMEKCLKLDPENAELHNALGLIRYSEGLNNAALEEFRAAEKLAPGEKQYSYNVGLALARLGRHDEANQAFARASGLGKGEETRRVFAEQTRANKAREMYNDGYTAMQKRELGRAIDLFQSALKLKPDIAEAHINLGVCYRMKRDKKQIYHFEEAAKLRPDMPDVHYNLGLAYSDAKMYPQAIAEFDRTIELKPSHRDAHFKLGTVLYRTRKFKDAALEFQRCVELSPRWFEAHLNLGSCYVKTGDIDGAIEHFQTAIELRPRSAEAHYSLGAAYMLAERYGEATALFQKALKLDPTHRKARLMLRELGEDQGK